MDSEIKFNAQSVLVDSLCVEDIGNCALEAIDNLGQYYYFVVKTIRGHSHVLSFGPLVPDVDILPKTYNLNYYYTTYTDTKMEKAMQKWALGPKGVNFEQLYQIDPHDALAYCVNVGPYFENIQED